MRYPLEDLLTNFSGQPGTTKALLQITENQCGVELPEDYKDFLIRFNGGEGFVGKHYLILWKVEELQEFNRAYQVNEYAPGLFIFGSTGGGDGFAFDIRTSPYCVRQVAFIGMSLPDAYFVADSFTKLLERMTEIDGSLF